jgi:osmotically-inducible protein OsmY
MNSMADNDRYRGYDQDRSRDREPYGQGRDETGRPDDDGYIARRGFGNRSAGYDRGRGSDPRHQDFDRRDQGGWNQGGRDQGRWDQGGWDQGPSDRGRDFGYGRDQGWSRERDFGDSAGYGSGGSARDWRDVMGNDRGARSGVFDRERDRVFGSGGDYGRTGSSQFGRGSREDDDDRGFFERAGDEVRSWFGGDDRESEQRHHRGRGPRNYTRSDDRIRDDVNDRLTDDPHIDASEIEVRVSSREVTLSGHVNNRFEKRHAEDLAESVSGVTHVQNNLRVQQSNAMGGMGGSSSAMTRDVVESYGGGRGSTDSDQASTANQGASGRRRSSSTSST